MYRAFLIIYNSNNESTNCNICNKYMNCYAPTCFDIKYVIFKGLNLLPM